MDKEKVEQVNQIRQKVAERIEQKNNENLAETLRNSTADQLTSSDYLGALKNMHPEHEKDINSIKQGIEALDKTQGREPDPDQYFSGDAFMPNRLAMEIEEDYDFVWNLFEETLYVYQDGVYQDRGERIIKEQCNIRLAGEFRTNRVNQVVEAIKTRPGVSKEKEEFKPPQYKINFENGVYDLQKQELLPHSSKYFFTQQIPWDYKENMDCPEIRDFLMEITGSEEDVQTLIEMVGYAMMTSMPIEHAFILVGKGSNGKTMFLELLKKVLNKKNVKDENLQQLESNRFSTSWLYRKLAVISDDLPDKPVEKGGVIKSLTGGSDVRAEGKGTTGFDFENYALPIFAANHIPPAEDQSNGFFRRWTIIDFPYQFKPETQYNPDNPIHKKAEPEMKLKNRIHDEKELLGLVSQAIASMEEVLQKGQFTHQDTPSEVRQKWNSYAEPVQEFIHEYVEQGINQDAARQGSYSNEGQYKLPSGADFVVKDDLHTIVKAFCDARSTIPPTKQELTRKLKDAELYFDPTARTTAVPNHAGQARVYRGLSWTSEWQELLEKADTVHELRSELGITDSQVQLPTRITGNLDQKQEESRTQIPQTITEKVKELDSGEGVQEMDVMDSVEQELGEEIAYNEFTTYIDKLCDDGVLYKPQETKLSLLQ